MTTPKAPEAAVARVQEALGCARFKVTYAFPEMDRISFDHCNTHGRSNTWTDRGCPVAVAAADAAVAPIAAQTLREAADDWGRDSPVTRWLNNRADRIEART